MNHIEEKRLNDSFGWLKGIEERLAWPHLQACSEKIAWLKPNETAELFRTSNEIIAKHMAKNGIDFFAALNSLQIENKIT
jgi:hypothetical protein